jgi:hypothetical protein
MSSDISRDEAFGDDAAIGSCRRAVFGRVDAICEAAILAGDAVRVRAGSTDCVFFRFGTKFTV